MAIRVLLVFDDFNELSLTETYLKKVGFDVEGISNEARIYDYILSFNPQIMVVCGGGSKVSSVSVGQKLKDGLRFNGKSVIIMPNGVRPRVSEMIKIKSDVMLEAPFEPEKLIQALAKLAAFDPIIMLEKFAKARMNDPELEQKLTQAKKATIGQTTVVVEKRRAERYKKFIEGVELDPKLTTHNKKTVAEAQSKLKKDWDFDKLEEQDELKRQFAKALFKKE
jgi:DNA-binding response OmpR family regulator